MVHLADRGAGIYTGESINREDFREPGQPISILKTCKRWRDIRDEKSEIAQEGLTLRTVYRIDLQGC